MLTCYFDGSGHIADSNGVFCVAGYISTVDEWSKFDQKWNKLLKHNGVDYFRMSEFVQSWKGKDRKQADFLRQLIRVTRTHVRRSFAISISVKLYNRGNELFVMKERGIVPLLICGGTCVEKAFRWRNERRPTEPIKFYFERGEKNWEILKNWMDRRGYACEDAPKIPDPQNPLDFPVTPFQAADFLAWEQRTLYINAILQSKPGLRGSLRELTTIPHEWETFQFKDYRRFARDNRLVLREKRN